MILDEFLIALGLKVDNADIARAEDLGDALDEIKEGAEGADGGLTRAYGATEGFIGAIEGALGVVGFFTGILGGLLASTHGVITELEDLIKEEKLLTRVTKEQIDQAKKYNDSVETLGKRFNSLRVEIAFSFLPTLQNLISGLDKFLETNKDLIVNGLTALLSAITSLFQVIGNFARFIDIIVTKTIGWKATLMILGAAFLWLKRAAILAFVTSPLGLFLLALGAIILLVDDFMTYMEGGESLFGEYWGAMIGWVKDNEGALRSLWDMLVLGMSYLIEFGFFVTKYLGGAFVDAVVAIMAILNLLVGIFTGDTELIKESWSVLCDSVLSMFENLAMLFEPIAQKLVQIMSAVWDAIVSYISLKISEIVSAISGLISSIGAALGNVFDIVTAPFTQAFDWIVNTFSKIPSLIGNIISKLPGVNAITSIGSAVSSGASRIVNNYGGSTSANINVTAPNAISAANQTASTLQNLTAQRNVGGEAYA